MFGRSWPGRRAPHGMGPTRRVMYRFASAPLGGPESTRRRPVRPSSDVAGARSVGVPLPTSAPGADELAVTAAIARFEHQARMGSAEFADRYLRGEFRHVAWARVWFSLLPRR